MGACQATSPNSVLIRCHGTVSRSRKRAAGGGRRQPVHRRSARCPGPAGASRSAMDTQFEDLTFTGGRRHGWQTVESTADPNNFYRHRHDPALATSTSVDYDHACRPSCVRRGASTSARETNSRPERKATVGSGRADSSTSNVRLFRGQDTSSAAVQAGRSGGLGWPARTTSGWRPRGPFDRQTSPAGLSTTVRGRDAPRVVGNQHALDMLYTGAGCPERRRSPWACADRWSPSTGCGPRAHARPQTCPVGAPCRAVIRGPCAADLAGS